MAEILVIDDEQMTRWSLERTLRDAGHSVLSAETAKRGMALFRQQQPEVVFLDIRLPDADGLTVLRRMKEEGGQEAAVIVMTAFGEVRTAKEAIKLGAYDYLRKPFNFDEVEVIVQKMLETTSLRREAGKLREARRKTYSLDNIVGRSEKMRRVLSLVDKVAESDATTVFLQGENGTGKSLLARAIHYRSRRAERPFLDISSTAVPERLFESELFGYERGAFTDAKAAKRGLLELANGGTVFLDEVGDMPLLSQAKLLRVLETKRFRRLGGTVDHHVDIRIIAATNRNLDEAVRRGCLRKDLYYRLRVVPVVIPPLRERSDDIPLLLESFMAKYNAEFRKHFRGTADVALRMLLNYPWPGNVRELKNVVERILILENDDMILPEHLPREIARCSTSTGEPRYRLPPTGIRLSEVERDFVRQALEIARGNQTRAAELLGLGRDALRYRMQKFGLTG